MHNAERTKRIKHNVKYLLRSRNETQVSLCSASGLNRTTLFNILDGRVDNIRLDTIRKISDFFEVSHEEIMSIDLEAKEILDNGVSLEGNINPSAVPIIKEKNILQSQTRKIGAMILSYPLTYYFGSASNMIGVLLEKEIPGEYDKGDLLIVRRGKVQGKKEILAYEKETKKLFITELDCIDYATADIIGEIIEERFYNA